MARQRSCSAPVTPLSRLNPQMEALRGAPEAAAAALASLDLPDKEASITAAAEQLQLEHEDRAGAAEPDHELAGGPATAQKYASQGSPFAGSKLEHRLRTSSTGSDDGPGSPKGQHT